LLLLLNSLVVLIVLVLKLLLKLFDKLVLAIDDVLTGLLLFLDFLAVTL
jgi:hypothetical protein